MKTIEVRYRTWWWPWARVARGKIPVSWGDMNKSQFLAVVRGMRGEVLSSSAYYSALLGLPIRLIERFDSFHFYAIDEILEWMQHAKSEVSKFFIPKIEGLRAPLNMLEGVTLQQFMTADTFHGYVTDSMKEDVLDGDVSLLCQFVAALYMRKRESYSVKDVRKTFFDMPGQDMKLVDISANAIMLEKRADRDMLWGVYVNWVLIRAWLARVYPLLFPEGDENATQSRVKNAWLKTFDAFVGDDVAHMDEYREMECMDAFRIMQNRLRESYQRKV